MPYDKTNERKNMNNKFDELTKGLAQSVTRRAALKKFGVGLAGMALACFGLVNAVEAQTSVVCDRAGGATCVYGKGCAQFSGWLGLVRALITCSGDSFWFTL